MATATYDLDIDWNDDLDFSDTGEDIDMSRVQVIECERGRDNASQLTGRSSGGTFRAVLDNRSGDYSSFNTSSPIAGEIEPGRKIRLRGSSAAQSNQPIWAGFTGRIVPVPSMHGNPVAVIEGIGALRQINPEKVSLAMRTSETTDVTIGAILDEIGWPAGDRDLDTGKTTISRYWTDRKNVISALRDIERAEAGFIYETADGKIAFDNRHARHSVAGYTSQGIFSDNIATGQPYSEIVQHDTEESIFNAFEATVQTYTVQALAVLWTLSEVGASAPGIPAGQSFTWWARYPNPGTSTDGAISVDAWTTPVATTDFTFNSAAGGGGSDLTTDMAISVTKFGNSMKMVFTNNHATATAYVQTLQARGTAVTADDPIFIREDDTASQDEYGCKTWPAQSRFIPSAQEARDWAKYHLGIYKQPVPFLTLSYWANYDETQLDHMLLRDIGDRLRIKADGAAGLGIDEDFYIERIRHHISLAGKLHRVSYVMSNANVFSGFWVLNHSELGTSTKLAY